MRARAAAATLGVATFALACGGEPPERIEVDPASLRTLTTGAVVGFENVENAHVWRGLPFAAPPVGPLRWRAPLPPEPWQGTREALAFGAPCVQYAGPLGASVEAEEGTPIGSEDCLTLSVYAPRYAADEVPTGSDRMPVMVWIHGGGNSIGEGATYDGTRIANGHRVLFVSVNYRLGPFGWLAHPALRASAANADDRSGNFGTLDLVRALEWVRDNAGAFGGDPGSVTVFGESAGGSNIASLLASPRAAGLFHRGIIQSGSTGSTPLPEGENWAEGELPEGERGHPKSSREVLALLLQADGSAADAAAARALADSWSDDETEAYLRGKGAYEILGVYEGRRLGGMLSFPGIFEDGHVIPEEGVLAAMRGGRVHRVPMMLGTNRDETKLFQLFSSPHVTRVLGIPLWVSDARRYELDNGYSSLSWKMGGADEPAAALVQHDPRVWVYRFDWDEEPAWLWSDYGEMLGAAHGLEIMFVFGGFDRGPLAPFMIDDENRARAEALSAQMMSYWAAFARDGDPRAGVGGDLPPWKAWNAETPGFMVLDTSADGGLRMSDDVVPTVADIVERVESDSRFADRRERCEIYADWVGWRMTRSEYDAVAGGACAAFPPQDLAGDG